MEKLKQKLKERIEMEWRLEVSDGLLEEIIHNEERLKMFKEMGYV